MSQNVPKKRRSVKAVLRRSKVIALAVEGKTNQEIADCLKVNEKTIDRDMQSAQVQEYVHDLVRRQMQDIESAKLPMRLSFRSDLLDKLLPKKMEQKIAGGESFRVEIVDNSKDPEPEASASS